MSRMFPFITHTINPLAGGPCPYQCDYCWATDLKHRHKWKKYTGAWRIIEKELKSFKEDDFVFPFDMTEIGCLEIPEIIIYKLFDWIWLNNPTFFLLLTKNPYFYRVYNEFIPPNAVLGATIETNMDITRRFSKAPIPWHRINDMIWVSQNLPNKTFVCIEPIMMIDDPSYFVFQLRRIEPWAVAVGYDNYHNKLPEPSLGKTEWLIEQLEKFTKVYRKTIREAWNRSSLPTRKGGDDVT